MFLFGLSQGPGLVGGIRDQIADIAFKRAQQSSQSRCAQFVREAIEEATHKSLAGRTNSAKDYGPILEQSGFELVASFPKGQPINESQLIKGESVLSQS